jgi:RNA polymerase subunit RPABC4/transcription elongation factor Spt4
MLEVTSVCPDCGSEIFSEVQGALRRRLETHPRLRELSRSELLAVMRCRHPKIICQRCGALLSNKTCPVCGKTSACK